MVRLPTSRDNTSDRTSLKAGEDACVPEQTMVRPGDRTSFIAGGDGCVPGVFEPEGVFVRISDRKITIRDTVFYRPHRHPPANTNHHTKRTLHPTLLPLLHHFICYICYICYISI